MSELRDRRGRFVTMPDHETTPDETPERPAADSVANQIEQSRADQAVDTLQGDGIDARSGARQAVDLSNLGMPTGTEGDSALAELQAAREQRDEQAQTFREWSAAPGESTPIAPTTRIVVDGRVAFGAPLDPTAQAAFIEQVRAQRAKADEDLAAFEQANDTKGSPI
jgi:hypothetical protein